MDTVQKLPERTKVQTTARYNWRGKEAKRRAVELLRVPYVPVEHTTVPARR